jgi:FemAB-related protein (PEP-CTERM system-associated)
VTQPVERFTGTAAEWNGFVRAAAGATHCHQYQWLELVGEVFGHETLPLAARDAAGGLTGVLPLVRVRTALFGHYLVSMPFLNDGGPLGWAGAVQALAAEAAALAARDAVTLLELRCRAEQPLDLAVSHRKITVLLDLPPDPNALWESFPAKLRSQIRRPEKEGVEVRFGTDQVEPFYRVFARHMRDLGTPVLPLRFFESMARRFADGVWFGCAWHRGAPIAGGAGLRFGEEVEITWASALRAHSRLAPNMLLYWAFLERACRDGAGLFNFGRCTPGGGTHRFKRQWGGRDVSLFWYQAGPAAGGGTPSADQGGLYSLGAKLWRLLPLPVTTALGPRLVRGIP